MKPIVYRLCIVITGAALIAGCNKKPLRPEPGSTVMGQQPGGPGALNPSAVQTTPDATAGLLPRDAGFDANGQNRTALESVYFETDRSAIRQSERAKLQAAKDYLDKNADAHLLLEGHCDWRGTSEYNLGLGDRRANEAKKFLIGLGVPADRMETLSKGSEEAKKNVDEATMSKDRRVDLVVLRKQ